MPQDYCANLFCWFRTVASMVAFGGSNLGFRPRGGGIS